MMPVDLRARATSPAQAARRSSGATSGRRAGRDALEPDAHRREIAVGERQLVELARGLLHPLVFEQPAHQLGARILAFVAMAPPAASAAAAAT